MDERLDRPELVADTIRRLLHRDLVGDVGLDRDELSLEWSEAVQEPLRLALMLTRHCHAMAVLQEPTGHCTAKGPSSPRDQHLSHSSIPFRF
jgi:hypothetical protein